MYTRLISFIDKQNVLIPAQYGFRKHQADQGYSAAIIDIVDKIHKNMDNEEFTCGVFVDLKKAFDTVDHSILLSKLYHYGMRGIICERFTSYLSSRSQTTTIGDYISKNENWSSSWSSSGISTRVHYYFFYMLMIFHYHQINLIFICLQIILVCSIRIEIFMPYSKT